jgi:hypothetical protein
LGTVVASATVAYISPPLGMGQSPAATKEAAVTVRAAGTRS